MSSIEKKLPALLILAAAQCWFYIAGVSTASRGLGAGHFADVESWLAGGWRRTGVRRLTLTDNIHCGAVEISAKDR